MLWISPQEGLGTGGCILIRILTGSLQCKGAGATPGSFHMSELFIPSTQGQPSHPVEETKWLYPKILWTQAGLLNLSLSIPPKSVLLSFIGQTSLLTDVETCWTAGSQTVLAYEYIHGVAIQGVKFPLSIFLCSFFPFFPSIHVNPPVVSFSSLLIF